MECYSKNKNRIFFMRNEKEVRKSLLYERAAQILIYLINSEKPHTICDLQKIMMVSNRTIRYDLDHIDDFLQQHKIKKLSRKPRVGISFEGSIQDKKMIKGILGNINKISYIFSPEERVKLILLVFIDNQSYITIEQLALQLGVSRSTIQNDRKKVKKILANYDLTIEFIHRQGSRLQGKEKDIRKLLSELWQEQIGKILYERQNTYYKKFCKFFEYDIFTRKLLEGIDLFFLENCLNILEKKLALSYSDVAFSNILSQFCVTIKRIKEGHNIVFEGNRESLKLTKEFMMVNYLKDLLENHFKISLDEDEMLHITTCLLGGNLTHMQEQDKGGDWLHIQLIVKKLIELVNKQILVDIGQDWQLFQSLLEHMKPMIYRLNYGIPLENPILHNIQSDYSILFDIVKKSMSCLKEFENKEINEDEIGYLTIHFGAAIEREKFNGVVRPKVLIVCNSGYGTSQWLSIQIQSMFMVDIVAATNLRKMKKILEEREVDLIISTIPIEKKENINLVYVKPILTEENIKELNHIFLKSHKKRIEIDGLIQIISKHCTIHNYERLKRDLYQIFNMKIIKDEDGDDQPVLGDIISENTIELKVDIKNWEEAIRRGGELLRREGFIEQSYIEAMVNSVKEIGPYIVITEGVAMPHARPEKGALKVGMSLIILKEPIDFGNQENDPVKLVLCFSAIDSKTHLKALSQLMILLEDKKAIEEIIQAKDKKEVLEIIHEFSKK